jgi:hypothetical protein
VALKEKLKNRRRRRKTETNYRLFVLDIKNLGPWNLAKKTVAKTLQVTIWQKLTRKESGFEFGLIVFVNDPFVILEMD